jgi:CRP/FNR family transcriptional regulator, cyclic AMP receptor protein
MDRASVVATLAETQLLRDVDPRTLELVASIAEERVIPPGQHVFFVGDLATEFYVVAEGAVRVYMPARGDELDIAIVHPGDLFGEGALLDGGPRLASALALEPTVLLVVPRAAWFKLLDAEGDLARQTFSAIGGSLRRYVGYALDLLFLDIEVPDAPPGEEPAGPHRDPI